MNDPLSRLNAALSGRYTVERELGEGGMAKVYLAKDLKHNRQVAIKVLKPELAAVVGAERFLAEIETTANLQHPNILPLYDSGEADTFIYYVMPFVEGESLRDRLDTEKQLPVDDAIRIAAAVANALDFAHSQGVIHRDIKPGNILFQGGQPVVGDFGIALAVGAGGGARLTETGLSVGTPYYMSPEQATGDQQVGARSDIYSLGCVLYEMLVGDPPYVGSTAQAVLGQIISGKPVTATEHRSAVPRHVDAAIRKSLEKVPADRFATAAQLAAALGDPGFRYGEGADAPTGNHGRWRGLAAVLGIVSLLLATALAVSTLGTSDGPRVSRYLLDPPSADPMRTFAWISPDGSRTAFVVIRDDFPLTAGAPGPDDSQIWVRSRNELDPRPVPGTGGARNLSFSPDGQRAAFLAEGMLKLLAFDDGRVSTLAESVALNSVHWESDGFIYAVPQASGASAQRFPAAGGPPEVVETPEAIGWVAGLDLSSDARILAGAAWTASLDPDSIQLFLLDPATQEHSFVGIGLQIRIASAGHLVYSTLDGRLMGQRFDPGSLQAVGPAVQLADEVTYFHLSEQGDLVYQRGAGLDFRGEVVWIDRTGTVEAIDWPFERGRLPTDPTLSPDGSKLALSVPQDSTSRIYTKDLVGGPITPLVDGGAFQTRPAWSADGREIGFVSDREDGQVRLWRRRADGSGQPTAVTGPVDDNQLDMGFWSFDQSTIVTGGSNSLNALDLGTDSEVASILEDGTAYENPTLSPDGRWVAYSARVDGERRIFVRPFPNVDDERVAISDGEGREPRWSPAGGELFYVRLTSAPSVELVSARVTTEPRFVVEEREVLIALQEGNTSLGGGWSYDVDRGGERFVAVRWALTLPEGRGLVLVENFLEELEAKMREGN